MFVRLVQLVIFSSCRFAGTIGIVMSSLVDRVIGLDVVEQAVQDAEFNADFNGNI